MKKYSLTAIETNQKYSLGVGKKIYTGKIKIKDFLDPISKDKDARFKIHSWQHEQIKEHNGYQRLPNHNRIEKIKKYLQDGEVKEPIFPTALLVNSRNPLKFEKFKKEELKDFGKLIINQTLYIIDGQHRIEAFKEIVKNSTLSEKYGFIELPIIILSNFKYKEEVEQFFVINSRQRKIKTDLAQRILVEVTKEDDNTKLIPKRKEWELPATTIIDELNEDPTSEWDGLISLPNDNKDIKKERLISQNSFIRSLKPFFIGNFKKWNYDREKKNGSKIVKECTSLIKDYWDMIKEVYDECFKNRKKSILFKTVGVYTLHLVLARYMNNHKDLSQKKAITAIKDLLIIARDKNKMDNNFWMTGNKLDRSKGVNAGAYSSSSGHNRLAVSILQKISPLQL